MIGGFQVGAFQLAYQQTGGGSQTGQTPAGSAGKRKRHYYVEIDGRNFPVESVDHARAVLDHAKRIALQTAQERVDQKVTRGARRIGLASPRIVTNAPVDVAPYREAINHAYEQAKIAAQIRLLMEQRDLEDDDESFIMLM